MTRVTKKQTLRSLSLPYQKNDGHAHPSFGITPTFQNLTLLASQIIFPKSRCHAKRRMGGLLLAWQWQRPQVPFSREWCVSYVNHLVKSCQALSLQKWFLRSAPLKRNALTDSDIIGLSVYAYFVGVVCMLDMQIYTLSFIQGIFKERWYLTLNSRPKQDPFAFAYKVCLVFLYFCTKGINSP